MHLTHDHAPMDAHDFITTDELDDLPDDPRSALIEIVRTAQRRLGNRVGGLDGNDEYQWQEKQDAYLGFMTVVIASAQRLEVEPFASMTVPNLNEFGYGDFRQFRFDLNHYMAQMMLDASIRGRRDSVAIPEKTMDDIKAYLNGLRQCIAAASISDAKRQALIDRLEEFEKELAKRRLSLMAVTLLSVQLLAIPGSLWASYDIAAKLVTNIMASVAEAKAAEDESRRLAPVEPQKQLMAPNRTEPVAKGYRRSLDDDDEIPF